MALTALFEHIGAKLKIANPWLNTYSVNCIQLPDKKNGQKGEVVNFLGQEKEYHGIDDSKGAAFYIRTNPQFTYSEQKRFSSCDPSYEVTVPFKFVFYAINQDEDFNPLKIESLFANNLRQMNFIDYFGGERKIKLVILKSNTDAFQVFFDEIGKKFDVGANAICVSIECQLKFLSTTDCEEQCGTSTGADILSTFDFCDPEVIARLCFKQKQCLEEEFGGSGGLKCEDLPTCPVIIEIEEDIDELFSEIANLSSKSISYDFVAGENLGGQRVVMISGGQAFHFDPTTEANLGKELGMTDSAAISGANVKVIMGGVITSGGFGLTQDAIYYAGANGTITQTIPVLGIDTRIGVAIDATNLKLEFSEPVVLI